MRTLSRVLLLFDNDASLEGRLDLWHDKGLGETISLQQKNDKNNFLVVSATSVFQ